MCPLPEWNASGELGYEEKIRYHLAGFYLLLLAYQTLLLVIAGIFHCIDNGQRAEVLGSEQEPPGPGVPIRGEGKCRTECSQPPLQQKSLRHKEITEEKTTNSYLKDYA